MKIQTPIDIDDERIKGLLCIAFEGGVGYWCRVRGYKFSKGLTIEDFRHGGKMQGADYWHPCQLVPMAPGCAVICVEHNEEDPKPLELTREKIEVGLQLMASKYPRHFTDFIDENDDATTGDVFLQCCLLGELVYG